MAPSCRKISCKLLFESYNADVAAFIRFNYKYEFSKKRSLRKSTLRHILTEVRDKPVRLTDLRYIKSFLRHCRELLLHAMNCPRFENGVPDRSPSPSISSESTMSTSDAYDWYEISTTVTPESSPLGSSSTSSVSICYCSRMSTGTQTDPLVFDLGEGTILSYATGVHLLRTNVIIDKTDNHLYVISDEF